MGPHERYSGRRLHTEDRYANPGGAGRAPQGGGRAPSRERRSGIGARRRRAVGVQVKARPTQIRRRARWDGALAVRRILLDNRPWFRARASGLGWTPITWEGWLVTLAVAGLFVVVDLVLIGLIKL